MCTSTAEPFVVIEIARQVIMCTLRELLAEDRNYLVAVHGHFRFMRRLLYVQTYLGFVLVSSLETGSDKLLDIAVGVTVGVSVHTISYKVNTVKIR